MLFVARPYAQVVAQRVAVDRGREAPAELAAANWPVAAVAVPPVLVVVGATVSVAARLCHESRARSSAVHRRGAGRRPGRLRAGRDGVTCDGTGHARGRGRRVCDTPSCPSERQRKR
ncbi:hypothetical protein GCM10023108_20590 [Saccharopolyspora hordei]